MAHLRKRFGQHFLSDPMVVESLLRAIGPSRGDRILEIGPGRGVISRHLTQLEDVDYIGVEIDRDLVAFLREKYPDIRIHSEDILKADLEQILEVENNSECAKTNWKIIGNLPYNISTQIFAKFIKLEKWPPSFSKIIFMFQKEVADRILAKPNTKDFSRITVLSNFRLDIVENFKISKNCFLLIVYIFY